MDKDAFELADTIRYKDDFKVETLRFDSDRTKLTELGLSLESLKVTEGITPTIHKALKQACKNLQLDFNKVVVYISPASEIQAQCISFTKDSCIITLSSKLCNLLNSDEITFVIGHELGHFLLSHTIENIITSKETLIALRAKEISVDRIGLWACRDINIAIRTIIKILSGLEDKLLSYDLNNFLQQIEHENVTFDQQRQGYSSHPSLLLRAKSLFRFSLSDQFQKLTKGTEGTSLTEIDNLIRKDLDLYSDGQLRSEISSSREIVELWIVIFAIVRKGKFTKEDQKFITKRFGEEKNIKLKNLLSEMESTEANDFTKDKLQNSITDFHNSAPAEAKRDLNLMIERIEEQTNSDGLLKEIQMFIKF